MERHRTDDAFSFLNESDHMMNSDLAPGFDNRIVALKALTHLQIAFNSPSPVVGRPSLSENQLGERAYRVGLEAFASSEGPK